MNAPLLPLDAVNVARAGVPILSHIDLTIVAGECVALLGENGAGKSTLLGTIIGWLAPQSGRILWRGAPIEGWLTHRRSRSGIGYCPEGRRPFGGLTVIDNLLAACWAPAERRRTLLAEQFELFPELDRRRDALAWQLSGGEAQMLALARAMMAEPQLLMLDEPFLGLSPDACERLSQGLQLLPRRGIALLVADDEPGRLAPLAPRWLRLKRGQIAPVDNSI